MIFNSRSFVQSEIYRPQPLVHFSDDESLILILTPWGSHENAETIKQIIVNYISAVKEDNEATSPFQKIPSLSPASNTLRTAVLLANDMLYKNRNKTEYLEAYEVFVGLKKNNEFVWTSHGHPHVLLSRKSKSILPLSLDLDHALNFQNKKALPPLPNSLLGVHSFFELSIKSLIPQEGDKLLLLNRSWISQELITTKTRTYDGFVKNLIEKDESAFWFGCLEF